jgi:hypothetical protein
MTAAVELLRQGRRSEIWGKYCGFIDLSLEEFMGIQERLLMEQIQLFGRCELGRKVMGRKVPTSMEEFRNVVPLTTYEDYLPYLLEKREDVLPEKPLYWIRTSGRSGEYPCKWVPLTERAFQDSGIRVIMAALIFATSSRREFALEEHDKFLYGMAPPPYGTGMMPYGLIKEFPFDFIPPIKQAEKLSFQERTEKGFELAMKEGLDLFYGLSMVLVKLGERFGQLSQNVRISTTLLHPKSLIRLIQGLIRSKLAGRPMLPKDLWTLKGILAAGMDTAIFSDAVEEYWGVAPLELYGSSEINLVATQTWDRKGMTFIPDVAFLEFIPEEEHLRHKENPTYQPRAVLLNEVRTGEKYEIVATNLKGGPFMRYRPGDMIRITALCNEELAIDTPQMVFEARCDDILDLGGFTRLTEKIIWQAIENSKIRYEDWIVRKEIKERPELHLYIELKDNDYTSENVAEAIHRELIKLDREYRDLQEMLEYRPLEVSLLSTGSFQRYYSDRQAADAELAHLKPPHINPSDEALERLLSMNS